jgi:hypothetical protein
VREVERPVRARCQGSKEDEHDGARRASVGVGYWNACQQDCAPHGLPVCKYFSHIHNSLSLSFFSLSLYTHRLSPLTLKLDAQGGMLWYIPALAGMGAAGEGGADRCCERGGEETAAGMLSALEACLLQSQVSRPESARALAASRMLSWPSACLCM